jgi:hypothetical protein
VSDGFNLINTGLQPGEEMREESENRFNGFQAGRETVETVFQIPGAANTGLQPLSLPISFLVMF